jgi:hypothetical protein
MKKLIYVGMLLLFSTIAVAGGTQLGLIGGLNMANLSEENAEYDSRMCFGFGGVVELGLGENLALCLQPMYLQKGASEDMMGITADIKLAYLEVPILLKYTLGSGSAKPYLLAGPTIGMNMSSKFVMEFLGVELEADTKDITESLDYGIDVGAGVSIALGKNNLFVEARYNLGLADIFKAGEIDFEGDKMEMEDYEVKTTGIQIMAGIKMPLGG